MLLGLLSITEDTEHLPILPRLCGWPVEKLWTKMSEAVANAFIREVWGLQGVAYLVVALRCYSRISANGIRGTSGDDILMYFATVSTMK